MYPVSAVFEFDQDDMVKGSGYITSQCCGSTEIELGNMSGSFADKIYNAGLRKPEVKRYLEKFLNAP